MIATAYPMKVSQALLDTSRDDPLRAIDMVTVYSHSTLAAKPSFPGPGAWLHGSGRALDRLVLARASHANLFRHDFGVCDGYANGLAAAAQVSCPSTLILGERDQMTVPKTARELAAALRARTVLLPGGHMLMSETPDGVLNALRQALTEKETQT
jgi:pimeloyl-ACP methyl ester carboxylesterase